jgi:hypothetical protein
MKTVHGMGIPDGSKKTDFCFTNGNKFTQHFDFEQYLANKDFWYILAQKIGIGCVLHIAKVM